MVKHRIICSLERPSGIQFLLIPVSLRGEAACLDVDYEIPRLATVFDPDYPSV